jgi:hypothetical protein
VEISYRVGGIVYDYVTDVAHTMGVGIAVGF